MQGLAVREAAQIAWQRGIGEEHAAHLEDGDGAVAAVDRDSWVGVMAQAVVVEVRVGQDDRRHPGRRRVVGKHAGNVTQHSFGDQLGRRPLRGVTRKIAAVGCYKRMPKSSRMRVPSSAATSTHMPPISC